TASRSPSRGRATPPTRRWTIPTTTLFRSPKAAAAATWRPSTFTDDPGGRGAYPLPLPFSRYRSRMRPDDEISRLRGPDSRRPGNGALAGLDRDRPDGQCGLGDDRRQHRIGHANRQRQRGRGNAVRPWEFREHRPAWGGQPLGGAPARIG